jgi:protein phosphatase 1D
MIKFGSSTRFFLLHGPDDDQETESQYTYTQLKEMRKQELEKREADYLENRAKLLGEGDDDDDDKGIDWGMGELYVREIMTKLIALFLIPRVIVGEDADAATDLTENPFALITNEDMYKDDPKKCLKQWFEREGEELRYHIEEKGFSQFRCTIE